MAKDTILKTFLQLATAEERERCAQLAGTQVSYLYQLSGLHRTNPGVRLALDLEAATRQMYEETKGRLPVVTARDLADMAAMSAFDIVKDGEGAA
jgi:hypothetical protein